jgi:hypothetical protein
MASRIIQAPDPGPDLGQSQDSGQDFGPYLPDVTAVRGSNSIEQISTPGLNLLTLIEVVIDGSLQFWQLQSGAATSDTENTVAPLDNPTGIHWQRIGGFGIAMMAAARVTRAAALTLSNNTPTTVSFDTERFNSGEWSATTNPSRITALVDGVYSISGSVSFGANAVGQRKLSIRKSAANDIASEQIQNASASLPTNITVSTITSLLAGEYVELVALQNTGGNLDILKTDQYSPEFAAVRLSAFSDMPVFSTPPTPDPIFTTPPGVVDTKKVFSITDTGWYQVWSGAYPASGSFNIKRSDNGDGQTSDTVVDFTVIADSPEGIINIGRNSVPSPDSPSIDGVRLYHDSSASLSYVEVHLLRGGEWSIQYSSSDANYLDSPFRVNDNAVGILPVLTYQLKPNVTGGTGKIDVPQIDSAGVKLLAPPSNLWTAPTGTAHRTTFNADGPPTLTEVSQHLKAVIDDLVAAGIFTVGISSSMTYVNMLELVPATVSEGTVANVTDVFNITAAPDTTVQGIYTPVANFNSHSAYRLQGFEYETGNTRVVRWSTEHSTWTIVNASGNLYHSGGTETHPWGVVQWKDEASSNVTVTITSPNVPFTYNALTDTHTAMVITTGGSPTGYEGVYLRGSDHNGKRRYFLVGTGTNNKRIEWDSTGIAWLVKDDSVTFDTAPFDTTYPDEAEFHDVTVSSVDAVDLMSGVTIAGGMPPFDAYVGTYLPVQGVYDVIGTHKLVYRRDDGLYFLAADDSTPGWLVTDPSFTPVAQSENTLGAFPWQVAWTSMGLTAQQNKVASGGFVNTYANNATGNFHI